MMFPKDKKYCRLTPEGLLEHLLEIGAIVEKNGRYFSEYDENMRQWTRYRVCLYLSRKYGYRSKHTRTIRNLVEETTDEYNIHWEKYEHWMMRDNSVKRMEQICQRDFTDLPKSAVHRATSYFSALKRLGFSDEKIGARLKPYLEKLFNGVSDIRTCRINSKHARYDA